MTNLAETRALEIPPALRDHDIWAVWAPEFGKQILAPWATGHCYPASWGEDAEQRPETEFSQAKTVAEFPPAELHEKYPFPHENGRPKIPETVLPTIILPHDPPDPPIMLVDFDDVRDPETGAVPEHVDRLVTDLDAYCEVSQSGEGLHAYVRAELPGNLGKFAGDFAHTEKLGEYTELHVSPDTDVVGVQPATPEEAADVGEDYPPGHVLAGAVELYDHGRIVGATWDHVDGTPLEVPERQSTVDQIVEEYETPAQRQRRVGEVSPNAGARDASIGKLAAEIRPDTDPGSDMSLYFRLDVRSIADTGVYRRNRRDTPGDEWQGPHPGHGPLHSDPKDCTNFGIDGSSDSWFCFAHESGGSPLDLAAVLAPTTDVRCGEIPRSAGSTAWLQDRPVEMLRTCLWVRDNGAVSDDAKPPYAALMGVAHVVGIETKTADKLGKTAYRVARSVYDDLESGDV